MSFVTNHCIQILLIEIFSQREMNSDCPLNLVILDCILNDIKDGILIKFPICRYRSFFKGLIFCNISFQFKLFDLNLKWLQHFSNIYLWVFAWCDFTSALSFVDLNFLYLIRVIIMQDFCWICDLCVQVKVLLGERKQVYILSLSFGL